MDSLYQIVTEVWKLWLIIGIVLMIAEGINLGTFALFFGGLGAFATAATCYFSPTVAASWTQQLLFFSALSLTSLLLLRPRLRRLIHNKTQLDEHAFIGKRAKALTFLRKNSLETGRVLFDGTEWQAVLSENSPDIPVGGIVEIVQIEGLTLQVRLVQTEHKQGG